MQPDDDITRSFVPLSVGAMVAHYRIIEKIGAGGMGEVYLAEDTKLDRKVALKFLPSSLCTDLECRARFTREAQAAAKLDHPNIVAVFEVGEFQNRPFFAMQHVEGQSLKEVIAGEPLPLDRVLEIGMQICDGLQAAHDKGVTHRDIKPANILIDAHGRARVVDFGLASIAGSENLTKAGSTLGTIGYMSPEQVRSEAVDHRSDLFSLGVLLYELIAGRAPFKADSEAATLHAIAYANPEPLARSRPDVPKALQTIVDKMLSKNPAARYQQADDIAADLRRITGATGGGSAPRKDLWNRYVVTAAAAVLLIVAGFWLSNRFRTTDSRGARPDRAMVVVLPFENLGSSDDEYFADGMTEEITTDLAGLSGLGVISRTSSMQYKKTSKNIRQIGKELKVDYVLEGTVRWEKSGSENRVRINSQLIRVSDDSHIWADHFDAVMTDVFQVQSSIARNVAEALDITLLKSEQDNLARTIDVDSRAYDYFLRGKQYFSVASYQQNQSLLAEKMFLQTTELAPRFAPAFAELGKLYTEMHWDGTDPSPVRLEKARAMIDTALMLAPTSADGHEALAWYYYHGLRDFDRALDECDTVLRMQPNSTLALASKAWVQRRQGKWQEAVSGLEQVNRLDPLDPWYKYELGITYHSCRRYQDAIAQFDQVLGLQPSLKWAYILKSWASTNLTGNTREGRAILEAGRALNGRWPELNWLEAYYDLCDGRYAEALSLITAYGDVIAPENADSSDYFVAKGDAYALSGQPRMAALYLDSARWRLERLVQAKPNSAPLLGSLAYVYAALGQSDRAVKTAQQAIQLVPISEDAVDGPIYERVLAMVYAMTGQTDAAMTEIEKLLRVPANLSVNVLLLMPEFSSLRSNPKFIQIVNTYRNQGAGNP